MGVVANLIARIRLDGATEVTSGLGRVRAGFTSTAASAEAMAVAVRGAHVALGALGSLAIGAGIAALGYQVFKTGVEFDTLTRSLASVSVNADDLHGQLGRLKEIAKLPGLGFDEAILGSVRLQNTGLSAADAERALLGFGNALALVGGGRNELNHVTLALMQMATAGRVMGQDLLQLQQNIPQIRLAMMAAFGTAQTEELAKMGITTKQFLDGVLQYLEKLPRASDGAKNSLENLGQGIKDAMAPLGQGMVEAFAAAGPLIELTLGRLEKLSRFLGEGLAAVVRSGALEEVFDAWAKAVQDTFGKQPVKAFSRFAGTVLAFFANLPGIIKSIGTYLSELFGALASNIETVLSRLGLLSNTPTVGQGDVRAAEQREMGYRRKPIPGYKPKKDGFVSLDDLRGVEQASMLGGFGNTIAGAAKTLVGSVGNYVATMMGFGGAKEGGGIKQMIADGVKQIMGGGNLAEALGVPKGTFDGLKALPRLDLDPFKQIGSDAPRFAAMIEKAWQALSDPEGLNFKTDMGVTAGGSPVMQALKAIERNTGKIANDLILRRQTVGGDELARAGVTPAELRSSGVSGLAPSEWQYARRPAHSMLEHYQRQVMQQEMARWAGRPRR